MLPRSRTFTFRVYFYDYCLRVIMRQPSMLAKNVELPGQKHRKVKSSRCISSFYKVLDFFKSGRYYPLLKLFISTYTSHLFWVNNLSLCVSLLNGCFQIHSTFYQSIPLLLSLCFFDISHLPLGSSHPDSHPLPPFPVLLFSPSSRTQSISFPNFKTLLTLFPSFLHFCHLHGQSIQVYPFLK